MAAPVPPGSTYVADAVPPAAVPEIDPRDPISYSGVLLMIVIVAVVASYIPARRAATINPVDALRAE